MAARAATATTAATAEPFAPGKYLTDGERLFRVVSQFTPGTDGVLASLEDCQTLLVAEYTPAELIALGLRTVSRDG